MKLKETKKTDIGNRIAQARKDCGMTQSELADKLGVTFQAVSLWERGETLPDTDNLISLADELHVSVSALVEDRGGYIFKNRKNIYDWTHMKNFVKFTATAKKMRNTLMALPFAIKAHDGQKRKRSDIPYIYHPLNLACHCLAMGIDDDAIIAACLLHDTVEDCGCNCDELPVDGETRELEAPFLVIATENPIETLGCFPLPEAQLDRFLMKLSMGTISAEEELAMIPGNRYFSAVLAWLQAVGEGVKQMLAGSVSRAAAARKTKSENKERKPGRVKTDSLEDEEEDITKDSEEDDILPDDSEESGSRAGFRRTNPARKNRIERSDADMLDKLDKPKRKLFFQKDYSDYDVDVELNEIDEADFFDDED